MILDLEDLPISQRENFETCQKLQAIRQGTSVALAAHVVLYKSLGLFKEVALCCMSELYRRRLLGEEYDFETFIDLECSKLPKVQPIDFSSIKGLINLQQISSLVSKGSRDI